MFQVIATTTRRSRKTQMWDLRAKNDRLEFSQTFFSLNELQNNELTFGKSNDTYLLLISPNGQFYKKTARGENKSRTFSNPTLYQHLISLGSLFQLEVFQRDETGIYYKFVAIPSPEDDEEAVEETPEEVSVDNTPIDRRDNFNNYIY
jgi:hypothetical protein